MGNGLGEIGNAWVIDRSSWTHGDSRKGNDRTNMLSATALVRVLTIDPALPAAAAPDLISALEKLFAQFTREDRCHAHAITVEADGRALVIAWEGAPLSGCSHDKINQVLSAHEGRTGCSLLAAPPLLVAVAGTPQALMRGGLRRLIQDGQVGPDSASWDVRATTLGAWRDSAGKPFAGSAVAALLG